MLSLEEKLQCNSNYFWKFINLKRKTNGYPTCMSFQNVTSEDPQTICDMIANFFKSVYTHITPVFDTNGIDTILDISGIDITENDVEIPLRELVGETSISSDGLAPVVLKNCCFSISLPLY